MKSAVKARSFWCWNSCDCIKVFCWVFVVVDIGKSSPALCQGRNCQWRLELKSRVYVSLSGYEWNNLLFPLSPGAVSDSYKWDTRAAEPGATLGCVPRLSQLLPGDGCGQARVCQGTSAGKIWSNCRWNRYPRDRFSHQIKASGSPPPLRMNLQSWCFQMKTKQNPRTVWVGRDL